jgi:serine protease
VLAAIGALIMKFLGYFQRLHSITGILLGMGVSCITVAGMPDDESIQGSTDAQLARSEMANATNRIIVKHHRTSNGRATISAVTEQVSQTTGHIMTHRGTTGTGAQIYTIDEMLTLDDAQLIAQQIESNPAIEYAEPDKRVFPLYTPNDPRYGEQWHYFDESSGIRLPTAWDRATGENVIIAIVDTGYTEHADLLNNLQLPGIDVVFDSAIAKDGDGRDQDALDPGDWSESCGWNESSWHGTHTAGIAAAVGDNAIGVTGVAYNAKILPVRALGGCGGWLSDIADGIIWAAGGTLSGLPVNETPAQVINVSSGGDSNGCSQFMQDAVNTALERGSTVIAAAGNTNSDAAGVEPANCEGVITVAATDADGYRASFSNYGNLVDISAPGVRVLSTLNSGTTTPENDDYEYYQGTSMAAPLVSGVAALLYSVRPDITPSEVEQVLKDNASPFPNECNGCGVGLLDATASLNALSVDEPDPQPDVIILENGVAQENFEGLDNDHLLFVIDVPDSAKSLDVEISGGSGDADLYVLYQSEPTLENYDCRPYRNGNEETCRISNPQTGRYYALVHGYSAFSDLSISASYDTDSDTTLNPIINRFENTDQYTIPDLAFSGITSPIDVPLTGESGTINVHAEITHPAMQEVLLKLISPNGESHWLRFADQGVNLDQTFTLELDNLEAQGRWQLKAIDIGFSGRGSIDNWSIEFSDITSQ